MMGQIKDGLQKLKPTKEFKKYGILFASIMFIWSGINKVQNYSSKVHTLQNKTNWPHWFSSSGMVLVILLEILGFIILLDYFYESNFILKDVEIHGTVFTKKDIIQIILLSLLAFLIVVTAIYHPFDTKHPIPFLSNLATFGLFLYVYADLFQVKEGFGVA